MRTYSVLSICLLLCGVAVSFAQSSGEYVFVSAEHSHEIRQSAFHCMWGKGVVNAGDASQPIQFSSQGAYPIEGGALEFSSEPFTLNRKASSIEFDGRFRFMVNSTEKDLPPVLEECNGKKVYRTEDCEFFMYMIRLVDVSTGKTLETIDGRMIGAKYGSVLDTLVGDRYTIDVSSLIGEKTESLKVQLQFTVLTGSSLFMNYKSGLSSSDVGSSFDLR